MYVAIQCCRGHVVLYSCSVVVAVDLFCMALSIFKFHWVLLKGDVGHAAVA